MKNCPKCLREHEKPGKFCSRTCANSRIFTAEAIEKKSKASAAYYSTPEHRQKISEAQKEYWKEVRQGTKEREVKVGSYTRGFTTAKLAAINLTEAQIKQASIETLSAASAARKLGITVARYKSLALFLGCYRINPGGKGKQVVSWEEKQRRFQRILDSVLRGEYPHIARVAYKRVLFGLGIKENKCARVNCPSGPLWLGQSIICELHHKDGNGKNNQLENIEILCPNCHSQTANYGSRNKRSQKV